MEKIVLFVSVILVSGLLGVDSLQCYQCFNCTVPTAADLTTCVDPNANTTTSSTTTSTAAPTTTSTAAPTTTSTAAPTTTSTAAPTTTSTAAPTTTSTAAPTTTSTAATTTTSTAAPTTTSTAATTTTSTAAPPTTTTSTTTTTTTTTEAPVPPADRSKRSILSPLSNTDVEGCSCRNEFGCECDGGIFSNRIMEYADDIPFVCYKATVKDNNQDIIIRGCAPATLNGTAACEVEEVKNMTTSCSTCTTDKCNGGSTVQYSVFMLAAIISVMLLK